MNLPLLGKNNNVSFLYVYQMSFVVNLISYAGFQWYQIHKREGDSGAQTPCEASLPWWLGNDAAFDFVIFER